MADKRTRDNNNIYQSLLPFINESPTVALAREDKFHALLILASSQSSSTTKSIVFQVSTYIWKMIPAPRDVIILTSWWCIRSLVLSCWMVVFWMQLLSKPFIDFVLLGGLGFKGEHIFLFSGWSSSRWRIVATAGAADNVCRITTKGTISAYCVACLLSSKVPLCETIFIADRWRSDQFTYLYTRRQFSPAQLATNRSNWNAQWIPFYLCCLWPARQLFVWASSLKARRECKNRSKVSRRLKYSNKRQKSLPHVRQGRVKGVTVPVYNVR